MNDNTTALGALSTITCAALTATQADDILRIIQLVFTILCAVVSLAYTVWKWWRKASSDGKITADEIDELMEEVKRNTPKDDN